MPVVRSAYMWTFCLAVVIGEPAGAADFGAVTSGNWNVPSTWTGGTAIPGASDNAYIGSVYPAGAATTATVTLTADQSISSVLLGRYNSTAGTLHLGTSHLIVANELNLGFYTGTPLTGTGTILRGAGGRFTTKDVNVYNPGSSLAFGAADVAQLLRVSSGAAATTAATGNVTGTVSVGAGTGVASSLTLGAPLTVSNTVLVGTGGTLNAQNHPITAHTLNFGNFSSSAVTIQNLSTLTASTQLNVGTGTQVTVGAGSSSAGSLSLAGGSLLAVPALSGQFGQLTVTGQSAATVGILDTSKLRFDLDGQAPGWVFRWANPNGGDHVGDLTTLISAGKIDFTYANGATYAITTDATYTYIITPVPEPATVFVIGAAGLGGGAFIRRRFAR